MGIIKKSCATWGTLLFLSVAEKTSKNFVVSASSSAERKTSTSLRRNRRVIAVEELDEESRLRKQPQLRLLEEAILRDEDIRFLEMEASLSIVDPGDGRTPIPPIEPLPTPPPIPDPTLAPTPAATSSPVLPEVPETDAPTPAVTSSFSIAPDTQVPETDAPTPAVTSSFSIAPDTQVPETDAPTPAATSSFSIAPDTQVPETYAPTPVSTSSFSIAPGTQVPDTQVPETFVPSPIPFVSERDLIIQDKCGVTELDRSRDILALLMSVSEGIMLVSPDTSQYLARTWIDEIDDAIICTTDADRLLQRYRASLLYYQLNGPLWTNCRAAADSDGEDECKEVEEEGMIEPVGGVRRVLESSAEHRRLKRNRRLQQDDTPSVPAVRFLDSSNECGWFGLNCGPNFVDDDGYYPILEIDLQDNNLAGELFDELYGFVELEGLYLDGNEGITGTISEALANLSSLMFLDLDENSISGELPLSIYTMTSLIAIDLNDNNLVGELSNNVGNLLNLSVLQLENNAFSGQVPTAGLYLLEKLGTC